MIVGQPPFCDEESPGEKIGQEVLPTVFVKAIGKRLEGVHARKASSQNALMSKIDSVPQRKAFFLSLLNL